jgi:S-adenosylmethionine synthetase
LTGRKIIVDQYGSYCEVGGGAFSGKDPSKVDRSAAYAARNMAVDLLNIYPFLNECKVMMGYSIGVEHPVSANVTYDSDSNILDHKIIEEYLLEYKRFTPNGIIEYFDLKRPIYASTAINGHFGYPNHPWEHVE